MSDIIKIEELKNGSVLTTARNGQKIQWADYTMAHVICTIAQVILEDEEKEESDESTDVQACYAGQCRAGYFANTHE